MTSPTSAQDVPDLEIRNVVKKFGAFAAVDDVSLELRPGEIVALLGPSGSGKSTLLSMIGGQTHPTAGEILLAGQPIAHLPPNRIDTATVFQDYALFPHMTVAENVSFGLRMRRCPAGQIEERTMNVLRMVELEDYRDRYPAQLSGGQQQRAATARALVVEPRLLLMDEPLSALDLQIRLRLQRELRDLLRRVGVTTLIVTHDQQEAFVLADRIAVLHEGRLEQIGRPGDLYRRPATRFVATFLGEGTLLPGEVLAESGGELAVSCLGATFKMPGGGRVGDNVTVLIRPEDVLISQARDTSAEGWPDATVTRVFNTGELTRYELDVLGRAVTAAELGRPNHRQGDTVSVRIKPDGMVAIPDTG